MTTTAKTELTAIQEDLAQLKNDLKELTGTLKDAGKQRIDTAQEKISDQADTLLGNLSMEELKEHLKNLKADSENALNTVKHQVEKYPAGSLLAAVGIGILIGKLFSSGNK